MQKPVRLSLFSLTTQELTHELSVTLHRQKHNLPALQVFLIDVISATQASLDHEDLVWLKDNKLSSTFIRQWVVDHDKQEKEEEQVVQLQ